MAPEAGKDKKRILVVDDERAVLELAEIKLKELGFDVITATSGNDCLKIAERESPDLILLDIMMPEMDGSQIAQFLLENPRTKDIPIIFVTSMISEEEEREQLGKIGNRLFVAKPFDKERISEAINKTLEG